MEPKLPFLQARASPGHLREMLGGRRRACTARGMQRLKGQAEASRLSPRAWTNRLRTSARPLIGPCPRTRPQKTTPSRRASSEPARSRAQEFATSRGVAASGSGGVRVAGEGGGLFFRGGQTPGAGISREIGGRRSWIAGEQTRASSFLCNFARAPLARSLALLGPGARGVQAPNAP